MSKDGMSYNGPKMSPTHVVALEADVIIWGGSSGGSIEPPKLNLKTTITNAWLKKK